MKNEKILYLLPQHNPFTLITIPFHQQHNFLPLHENAISQQQFIARLCVTIRIENIKAWKYALEWEQREKYILNKFYERFLSFLLCSDYKHSFSSYNFFINSALYTFLTISSEECGFIQIYDTILLSFTIYYAVFVSNCGNVLRFLSLTPKRFLYSPTCSRSLFSIYCLSKKLTLAQHEWLQLTLQISKLRNDIWNTLGRQVGENYWNFYFQS